MNKLIRVITSMSNLANLDHHLDVLIKTGAATISCIFQ